MIWHNLDTFPHSNPCNIGITCFSYFWTEYFKHILYATVSKRPNQIAIIKKLFWDKDELVPEFRNEEDAVNQMELKPKRKAESGTILLVLDDVWCGSESLLAKFKFQISESKVLVTSRNEFPEFGSTYNLELWNKEDTMVLFRHSATPSMEAVISHTVMILWRRWFVTLHCTYTSSICIHLFYLQTTSNFIC